MPRIIVLNISSTKYSWTETTREESEIKGIEIRDEKTKSIEKGDFGELNSKIGYLDSQIGNIRTTELIL